MEENVFHYKGYMGSVEVSLVNNCLFGKVKGLSKMLLSYEGQTIEELRADFEDAIDEYLNDCKKSNCDPQKAEIKNKDNTRGVKKLDNETE